MAQVIAGLKAESESVEASKRSAHQALCLKLIEQHGACDVGIVFTYLMNIVSLRAGQWFLIEAGVPHAYI